MNRKLFTGILVLSLSILISACSTAAAQTLQPTSTDNTAPTPMVSTAVVGYPGVLPAITPTQPAGDPGVGGLTVTRNDSGKTIRIKQGDSFVLSLGEDYNWQVSIDQPDVVFRKIGVLMVRGSQGIYDALKPGTATLTAVGDLPCRTANPPCMAPSLMFEVHIVVE